ncbi:MAG: activator of HSP90 ATPase [Chloroflexota bacterium]
MSTDLAPTRSVTHGTFTVERTIKAPPARVFRAFADLEQKKRWFNGPPEWDPDVHEAFEFRPGGRESSHGGPKGGTVHRFEARYHDIIENERIVYTYEMYLDAARISVSAVSIEFRPHPAGTHLVCTEHGIHLDGHDTVEGREEGTRWIFDNMAQVVEAGD